MSERSYQRRAESSKNPLTKALLQTMLAKKSNLCVAADVTTADALLKLLPLIGPHICLLKLHVDILVDFTPAFIDAVVKAKEQYNFLIFEDRKFADIGSTVANQYQHGIYKIVEWADIVTVHAVPGEGIISGLAQVAKTVQAPRGILLLAEMSSKGNLCTPNYANATIEMAARHQDFVVGFISQSRQAGISSEYLVMTPGVSLASAGDALGQQYATPADAIQRGADIVIVGRGIYGASDPAAEVQRYREAGWQAYLDILS
ncbi:orotidine 5'-phosphate decarboxylase [Protomyces lactucae-debilis]|uniref:Orotidine 5'-phosphate decarboxylase n=1 Tax=Protomyces lactucae-debilis TaxID=2754530 RepID=A0A1Y2FQK1_PROLT|nr:orotidine 5'-phosphate decarboxylase [Protomyces lactucae-debilis]ORY86260.1 orotidine 5'-phosphate decarboxylase [Protomyces lactucae-debilis]